MRTGLHFAGPIPLLPGKCVNYSCQRPLSADEMPDRFAACCDPPAAAFPETVTALP